MPSNMTRLLKQSLRLMAAASVLMSPVTVAQKTERPELVAIDERVSEAMLSITKREQAQIDRIQSFLASMQPKLMDQLEKAGVLPKMERDMKRIMSAKSDDERRKRISEYQNKYRTTYAAIWDKAGYRTSAVLEKLRALAPDYEIQVNEDFGFVVTSSRLREGDGEPPVDIAPKKTTEVSRWPASMFTHRFRPLAGGAVGITEANANRSFVRIGAGGLGGAGGFAVGTTGFSVPLEIDEASVRLESVSNLETFAASLGGLAYSYMTTSTNIFYMSNDTGRERPVEVRAVISELRSFAPVAWATQMRIRDWAHVVESALPTDSQRITYMSAGAQGSASGYIVGISGGQAETSDFIVERTYIY